MITVSEYFEGKVKSLSLTADGEKATLGVIGKGDFEFGTGTVEIMKIVSGTLEAKLPGETSFKPYTAGTSFTVEAGKKFQVKAAADVAYLCLYR